VEQADKIGADFTVNSSEQDVGEAVKSLTGGAGADIVIDTVGTKDTLLQAIGSLRRAGRIVMVGESDDTVPLSTFQLCVNEFEVVGSRSGSRQDTVEGLDLVSKGVVKPYVSDKFPLDRINDAFQMISQGKVMGRAVITFK
jgi:D-arabinose 1-dehydrogenase-like Zn-dependent alcohol dehydrogenase